MKLLIAEPSAIYRSIMKEIVSFNNNLALCAVVETENDFFQKIQMFHPDCITADSSIFQKNMENVLYELEKINIPTILFMSEKDKNIKSKRNVITIVKPNFESFSSEKIKECALGLETTFKSLNNQIYSQKAPVLDNSVSEKTCPDCFLEKKAYSFHYEALCIGVSTGGPSTILELLSGLGSNFPLPIFITQHIDETFDKSLIEWLRKNLSLPVHLAKDNEIPQNGHVYFAPAESHLTFAKKDGIVRMQLNHDEPINFLRPAVDKMFNSAAQVFGSKCIATLLTGMGNDGADGCCNIKKAGGYTIAQDEKSCIVFGMPKAAIESGGASIVLSLDKIADCLKKLVN